MIKEIPTSVRSRLHVSMDWRPKSFTQINNIRPYLSVHRTERDRPQHLATTPDSRIRPVEHFNSHGELVLNAFSCPSNQSSSSYAPALANNSKAIVTAHTYPHTTQGDTCSKCTSTNIVPVVPSVEGRHTPLATLGDPKDIAPTILDVKKLHLDTDAEGDLDLDDLELKYPEVPDINPPNPLQTSGHKAESEHTPTKRQKLSHPVIDLTDPSSAQLPQSIDLQATCATTEPKSDKSSKKPARSLKLCSTSDCTGIVSSGSFASRCLSCVRREWKIKREGSRQTPLALRNFRESIQGTSSTSDVSAMPKRVKKKGVSWADEISQQPSRSSPSHDLGNTDSTSDSQVVAPKARESFTSYDEPLDSSSPVLEDYLKLDGSVEAESSGTWPTAPSEEVSPKSHTPRNLSGSSSGADFDAHSFSEDKYETSNSNGTEHISGWNSDLSDVTDSSEGESESGSSSAEDKLSRPSVPSGFKIRIPARPAGTYTASQRCDQLLSTGCRWKSCVWCRARSRDYQRRKQNLPNHLRLEDELMDAQTMGTPLAAGLAQEAPKHREVIGLVPGARLCAIRTCTFIIPPVSEYRWKMCSLCRVRLRERRKQERVTDGNASPSTSEPSSSSRRKTVVADSNFMLRYLEFLCKADPVDGSDRCRSLDCGMMLANSSSQDCRQCIARRLWLVNRGPSNYNRPEGPTLLHRGNKKPLERPRGPAPYPRFKCFSAMLFEFKNRLSDFLRAHSIFFLFNQPRSANALFAFDGEFSVVALDFDVEKRVEEVDANVLRLKKEIEYVGRIKFSPKRLVSTLEGEGISVRFSCFYPVPMLQPKQKDGQTSINTFAKNMQCELEIAILPDRSHRFIPGQRTIIRFRLFG
ncbi:hypothetical protein CVT25_011166 [Psilocybe cyanescens]|uniref:Uncharacterized protein n=1 Tax=Psilocybe cyanescens TaxID=93625 RepID=A0A409WGX3_PSICY|nr:hypothetical protein CVT25_011166 [Psilocybe cyanescens]